MTVEEQVAELFSPWDRDDEPDVFVGSFLKLIFVRDGANAIEALDVAAQDRLPFRFTRLPVRP